MLRSRSIILRALGALVLSAVTVSGADATDRAMQAAATSLPTSTAIVVSATNAPLRVAGSDGADHLEYDLIVTNAFDAPVALTEVDVLGPTGDILLRLTGDPLTEATQSLLGQTPMKEIPASGTAAVVVDVVVPHGQPLDRLTHRITYAVAPDAPARSMIGSFTVDGPVLTVDPRPATVLAPPLRGDGWLAGNACCGPDGAHRSARIPIGGTHFGKQETFAIDFVQLRDGKLFSGDGSRPDEWFDFGAAVYAVANGAVVAVRDDMPEERPQQPVQHVAGPEDYGGNYVILAIAPGVYAFYAHLQPGSITVKVGDAVKTGQMLAKLGNSGNSAAPHLHFGLLDAPDVLANSLPMEFAHWTLAGTISPAAAATATLTSALPLEGPSRPETDTLPLSRDVADFR